MPTVKMIETKTKKGQYYPNQLAYQLVLNPGRCKVVAEYIIYNLDTFKYSLFKDYANGRILDTNIRNSGYKRIK
jgi:hypothetical protein